MTPKSIIALVFVFFAFASFANASDQPYREVALKSGETVSGVVFSLTKNSRLWLSNQVRVFEPAREVEYPKTEKAMSRLPVGARVRVYASVKAGASAAKPTLRVGSAFRQPRVDSKDKPILAQQAQSGPLFTRWRNELSASVSSISQSAETWTRYSTPEQRTFIVVFPFLVGLTFAVTFYLREEAKRDKVRDILGQTIKPAKPKSLLSRSP